MKVNDVPLTSKILDHFHSFVSCSDDAGCRFWTGSYTPDGYGQFNVIGEKAPNGKIARTRATRLAYRVAYGDFDENMQVLHTCDNPWCVEPSHLWLGTHADNMRDKCEKRRQAIGSAHGKSVLTEDQVAVIKQRISQGDPKTSIAEDFGIGKTTVYNIACGNTWGHVDPIGNE